MTVRAIRVIELNQPSVESGNVLRKRSAPIRPEVDDVVELVNDLRDTFYASKIAVGLAAVQIGVLKRAFVANLHKDDPAQELIALNPEAVSITGSKDKKFESCMSVPNRRGQVIRRDKILLRYMDANLDFREEMFTGYMSRVIQHEMDHLDGRLCFDHVEDVSKIEEFLFLNSENYPVKPIPG